VSVAQLRMRFENDALIPQTSTQSIQLNPTPTTPILSLQQQQQPLPPQQQLPHQHSQPQHQHYSAHTANKVWKMRDKEINTTSNIVVTNISSSTPVNKTNITPTVQQPHQHQHQHQHQQQNELHPNDEQDDSHHKFHRSQSLSAGNSSQSMQRSYSLSIPKKPPGLQPLPQNPQFPNN